MKRLATLLSLGFILTVSGCSKSNNSDIFPGYIAELNHVDSLGYAFKDTDKKRYGGHTLLEAGIDTTFANPLIRQGLDYNSIIIKAGIIDSDGKILPREDKNITDSNAYEINGQTDTSNAKQDGTRVNTVIGKAIRALLID